MKPGFIGPDWSDLPAVRVFCSTRIGGASVSPFDEFNLATHVGDDLTVVQSNRDQLRKALPGEPELQWLNQIHGQDVVEVTKAGDIITADGLITRSPGVACCVLTADCLPVVLASEEQSEVAVVHAGWRGLAGGILEQAISKMETRPECIRVWLGPAIGPCHFEVGEDVRQAFMSAAIPGFADCFSATSTEGKYMADLVCLARLKLASAGVRSVDACGACSYCDAERFYSYRREPITGRNVTGVYLLA